MRFSSRAAAIALLVIAVTLATVNACITALRATIPRALDDVVVNKASLAEKHPGVDDAYVLYFESRDRIQVEAPVYHAARPGSHLQKAAWERTLRVDGEPLALHWSSDARGMARLMPLAVLAVVLQVGWIARRNAG